MTMELLLLSNSTMPGEPYLGYSLPLVEDFLAGIDSGIVFVPYAIVTRGLDEYRDMVSEAFGRIGKRVDSLHDLTDPLGALESARAIVVGGGNTFHLAHHCQRLGLLGPIRRRVREGARYLGWSAGSNLACPTLMTTNDMPIVQPESFDTLGLVGFQINAHFTQASLPGHGGETREMRLAEFTHANPARPVLGLREGTGFCQLGQRRFLVGGKSARLFAAGAAPREVESDDALEALPW